MAPPALFACPSCSIHVKRGEGRCPHCGAAIAGEGPPLRTATALLMGLTLSACPAVEPQPEYGVPATESASDSATTTAGTTEATDGATTGSTSGTASGTASASGTSTTTDATTTTTTTDGTTATVTGEPEYGVPDTSPFAPPRARE